MDKNIISHKYSISKEDRNIKNAHNSFLIWFTGLSGSGKSTLANALEVKLHEENIKVFTLDGDNIRKGINKNLGFSHEDRTENIRRIAEISKLFIEAGIVTIAAFISPYLSDRENIKKIVGINDYVEIYVNTPIEVCEKRDIKGLYKKARTGEIKEFTGVSSVYEKPLNPDITIDTSKEDVNQAVNKIYNYIKQRLNND